MFLLFCFVFYNVIKTSLEDNNPLEDQNPALLQPMLAGLFNPLCARSPRIEKSRSWAKTEQSPVTKSNSFCCSVENKRVLKSVALKKLRTFNSCVSAVLQAVSLQSFTEMKWTPTLLPESPGETEAQNPQDGVQAAPVLPLLFGFWGSLCSSPSCLALFQVVLFLRRFQVFLLENCKFIYR